MSDDGAGSSRGRGTRCLSFSSQQIAMMYGNLLPLPLASCSTWHVVACEKYHPPSLRLLTYCIMLVWFGYGFLSLLDIWTFHKDNGIQTGDFTEITLIQFLCFLMSVHSQPFYASSLIMSFLCPHLRNMFIFSLVVFQCNCCSPLLAVKFTEHSPIYWLLCFAMINIIIVI